MLVVIDTDSVLYKAGFAVETAVYEIIAEDEKGELRAASFTDKQEAGEWIYSIGADPDLAQIEVTREAEPVENALQIVRTMLANIVQETSPGTPEVYLSGSTNFRDKIATLKPYKGNRDKAHKPIHYAAMREYLVKRWDAVISDNCEADDLVSIRARETECIVAGIDKDLDQIPGRHYDFSKKVHYEISEEDAAHAFWMQVLTGDASDNVGGVFRMGPKKADKWLKEAASIDMDPWKAAVQAYAVSQTISGCPYANKDPVAVALENAQLVYLQREPGDLWTPERWYRSKAA